MTKNEVVKMMLDATSVELEKAKLNYAGFPSDCVAKRAAKKEVMRLLKSSIAQQAAMHSPFNK